MNGIRYITVPKSNYMATFYTEYFICNIYGMCEKVDIYEYNTHRLVSLTPIETEDRGS